MVNRWGKLPAEVRSQILCHVADEYRYLPERRTRAGYATVSKEWQALFEYRIWQGLVLDQHRLVEFEAFTGRDINKHRRDYVRRIWFRVKLEEYNCTVCDLPEQSQSETTFRDDNTISRAIEQLFTILSHWARREGRPGFTPGIILDLGFFSPSDSKHGHKPFCLDKMYPYLTQDDFDDHQAYKQAYDDPSRLGLSTCPSRSTRTVEPSRHYAERLLGPNIRTHDQVAVRLPGFGSVLPDVRVVDDLRLRRQYYRVVSPHTIRRILDCLICLQHFRREFWSADGSYHMHWGGMEILDEGMFALALPKTLRSIHIFVASSPIVQPPELDPQFRLRDSLAYRLVGDRFAQELGKCQSLEHLSMAFYLDAEGLCQGIALQNNQRWPNLRTLSLTGCGLLLEILPIPRTNLLHVVAQAALLMPKLEILELWYGFEGEGCVLQYLDGRRENIDPIVCFRSTSRHIFYPHVQMVTRKFLSPIAARTPKRNLRFEFGLLQLQPGLDEVRSYADVLPHTLLGDRILDPVSRFQIEWEKEHDWRG